MPRRMLTDELWSKLKGILRQRRIYDKPFLRDMVEGMLYRMRVGCPWRDLPKEFGCWNTIYQKFNRWSAKNKWMMIFKMPVHEPDLEWEFIDGSIIKAHQHSAGAASKVSANQLQETRQKYTWLLMVLACPLNLKSRVAKSMIVKLHQNWLINSLYQIM